MVVVLVVVAISILTWGAICSIPGEIPIFQGKVRVARGYCVSVSLSLSLSLMIGLSALGRYLPRDR